MGFGLEGDGILGFLGSVGCLSKARYGSPSPTSFSKPAAFSSGLFVGIKEGAINLRRSGDQRRAFRPNFQPVKLVGRGSVGTVKGGEQLLEVGVGEI